MNACGAADIIAKMCGDDDEDEAFVCDYVLFRRIDDRLLSQNVESPREHDLDDLDHEKRPDRTMDGIKKHGS